MDKEIFSDKQAQFILEANSRFNLAHGPVRSGKTVGVLFAFMQAVKECEGDQIWMIGHTIDTLYHNCVRLILDDKSAHFGLFAPYCTWHAHDRYLSFLDKKIYCVGSKDEGAIKAIQGKTFDLCYCNEMTLFPVNIIQMIITRLSMPHSRLYADMNPTTPDHLCKKMIDMADSGDPSYYAMQITLSDNPFLTESFITTLKQTLSGVFFRRNFLGEWCQAEGAIYDFFDEDIHTALSPRGTTLYWIAGIDYGASNPFACVLVRVSKLPHGYQLWVEKELFHDPKKSRTKTNSELCEDVVKFLGDYSVQAVYLDPSAASFKAELRKAGIHTVETDNDVFDGILQTSNAIKDGKLLISPICRELIREIRGYVWDQKAVDKGEDRPLKKNDHLCDALRYVCASHIVKLPSIGSHTSNSLVGKDKFERPDDRPKFVSYPMWR